MRRSGAIGSADSNGTSVGNLGGGISFSKNNDLDWNLLLLAGVRPAIEKPHVQPACSLHPLHDAGPGCGKDWHQLEM